jgi:hypothetical protein
VLTSYDPVTGGDVVNQVQGVYSGLDQLTAEYQANSGTVDTSTTPVVLYAEPIGVTIGVTIITIGVITIGVTVTIGVTIGVIFTIAQSSHNRGNRRTIG